VANAVAVLNGVQSKFKARLDMLKTQYDFITNLFLLNRWAGKLSDESVERVNVWLSANDMTDPAPARETKP
jgi:outer membrane protein